MTCICGRIVVMRQSPPRQSIVEQILADIESAFGNVVLGDGISLHQARALDDYESEAQAAVVRNLDTESRWQDLSDEEVDQFGDALPFMDAAGFRFHMPRFMVFALTAGLNGSDSFAVDATIYQCDFSEELKDYAMLRYALLSSEQRKVIAEFLRFIVEHPHDFHASVAAQALEKYWSRHE